ncbi:DUF1735 and LamG domain-containing protein [Prevotella sp. KH2C16]|uniref:DUF1735 and LamG domain-containing protein n=1 Tax=Prevotella sp. KH2C16 TaxID=1855325 RepID=UPI0008F3F160|nr:DUF1735 and LamG domain-containing protein [Prevotella sp. KH2C16]SFF90913.1 Concanavalin A-like lectin/glucanases superfamily protein [Prevotella sp. KH2C16]
MLAFAGLVLLAFSSCENAEYSVLENQAFFEQTKTNANTVQKLTVEDAAATNASFKVQLSSPAQSSSKFEIQIDQAALDKYNTENFTTYKVLPTNGYTMSSNEVTVDAGQTISSPVDIKINPFTEEQKKNAEKFALPLKLVSKDGKQSVLNSGGAMIFLLDKVVRQAVPTYSANNPIVFHMKEDFNALQWTVEFCVNIDKLGTKVGEMNNQQLFSGWGKDGGEIFTRFGDAPIEGNRMNIKTQGSQMNSNMKFSINTWYHIAIVCTGTSLSLYVNGVLDNTVAMPGKAVNISKDNWHAGNSDDERFTYLKGNVMMGEIRIWSKALTQPQIANNMYAVDPNSEGLYAYFKMDEGSGNSFSDVRKNGNTALVPPSLLYKDIVWTQDVRFDGK